MCSLMGLIDSLKRVLQVLPTMKLQTNQTIANLMSAHGYGFNIQCLTHTHTDTHDVMWWFDFYFIMINMYTRFNIAIAITIGGAFNLRAINDSPK